jgi:hypothetical protein
MFDILVSAVDDDLSTGLVFLVCSYILRGYEMDGLTLLGVS